MRRPSLPTVISLLALFIALGGTSYAVIRLPANSVGNRQIKNNAVTASKIRNGSIGPSKLSGVVAGRGPRGPEGPAGGSGPGSGSTAIGPPEPWQGLPFTGGWTNYAYEFDLGAFRKDQLGKVHLRGLVTKNGGLPAIGDTIATLPSGYRPTRRMIFAASAGGPFEVYGRVDVKPSGEIVWVAGGTAETDFASLDTISFSTD